MIKDAVKKVLSEVPDYLTGMDRQKLIGEKVMTLSQGERTEMRKYIEKALSKMGTNGASDIDMGSMGCRNLIWYRVHGIKSPDEEFQKLEYPETDVLLQNLLAPSQMEFLYEKRNLDFSYQIETGDEIYRYRADMYMDLDHLALNCRFISNEIRPFKNLELHPNVVKALSLQTDKQGLTLVTGITGSGKSSTLDSIIDANNKTNDAHIVIIASPIETIHRSARCIVRHREIGRDVFSFKAGAIQALRQDPDIIVIGEMRDPETIITALEITDSGHKVFSTLHTGSAVESIDRIIGECPPEEQERVRMRLADTLKCVISQKLVPTIDGKRALVKEIMLMTPSIMAAIKNNNTGEIYQMINEGKDQGMTTLEQDLARVVNEGKISQQEAENQANNKKRLRSLLGLPT
ncbi:MAG: PilT/PilU family type 4a pilus ATPase [bacterium]|nr:PilT/PilU family type 4a pilus ATPase [bacterium]